MGERFKEAKAASGSLVNGVVVVVQGKVKAPVLADPLFQAEGKVMTGEMDQSGSWCQGLIGFASGFGAEGDQPLRFPTVRKREELGAGEDRTRHTAVPADAALEHPGLVKIIDGAQRQAGI